MFRRYVLPWFVYLFYRMWTATWRMEVREAPGLKRSLSEGRPVVFAHWHGDELKVLNLVRRYRIATMTSTSKDGTLIDFAIRKLGGATSRGSSTRGGVAALKGLVRLVRRDGHNASMAVDGPKGPLHKVKPGVFELSRLAGVGISAMGAAASNSHIFRKSWNKADLPLPFARVVVIFNDPWPALSKDDSPQDPALAARLEVEIAKACQAAAQHLR